MYIKMSGNLPAHIAPPWEFIGESGEVVRR